MPEQEKWLDTKDGRKFCEFCADVAVNYASPCIMPEHILLVLLSLKGGKRLLTDDAIENINVRIGMFLSNMPKAKSVNVEMDTAFAQRFWKRVDMLCEEYSLSKPAFSIILLALIMEDESEAQYALASVGVKEYDIRDALCQGQEYRLKQAMQNSSEEAPKAEDNYLIELVALASKGEIDPLIGRRDEVEEVMRILNRKKKSSPVLIGAPGVGKTAVVEGLAWLISRGEVPPTMRNSKIYSLQTGAIMAGASMQGEFEKRVRSILDFIEADRNAILFLDELHTVMSAGNVNHNASGSAGNLLKPDIASGKLRVIGATTDDDYRKTIEPDKAFARRFQPIVVNEPNDTETLEILLGLEPSYAKYHKVHFPEQILKRIIDLTKRYVYDRHLPDKAIDVMDTVGAKYRLHSKDKADKTEEISTATNADIDAVVCSMAKIPSIPSSSGDDDLAELVNLEDRLNEVVFGQKEAISLLARAIKISKCGLLPTRAGTIGNFFFSGPSGVGKTEVSKRLAEILNVKLIRFDMSEYSNEQMVTRFIGSAPGLVGFEEGGQLTNAVRECPHCVLLLDEVEKAHYLVHSLLLQVMDNGMLTDSKGAKTDFHNVILIMTGNVGCTEASAKSSRLGFGTSAETTIDPDIIKQEMRRVFSPEFLARLTASVVFNPLGLPELEKIVEYKFGIISKLAESRGFKLTLTDEARSQIAVDARKMNQGARPVDKIIEEQVSTRLVEMMINGCKQKTFAVVVENGELQMKSN